ncbi:TetR/AcrR family transcriptional regulator [Agromyces laixinhei]|uniref:TetR/AcrR family transcriptional regulator n=1 Tax=Agromyces laixinhei TaxID=2585717 RepID=UPI0012ED4D8F|nr:TetR/AcrR family transcriptional regulator [Agromyces laixinhei]
MPRPRFDKLPATQQAAILNVALAEFAAHGYRDASLNRIIETAATSKGSMYYYFDGKEDLYAHVILVQLQGLLQEGGPSRIPDAHDPDSFWAALEDYYLRLMQMLTASPRVAALLRDWLTGGAPSLYDARHDVELQVMPWLARTVAAGQDVGAVRTDIPTDLILTLAMGMGQAMDTWLITRTPEAIDVPNAVHILIDTMRRALGPVESSPARPERMPRAPDAARE